MGQTYGKFSEQNESALYGPPAAPGSSAQLDITWVAAYVYEGEPQES
ncbi:hypothetical protein AB0P36_26625 [Streptomyces flavidovirens]